MERVGWIDFLRGISMIAILMFHTEVYYKEYDVTPYCIYTTNAIILFYFISGYLFYRQKTFSFTRKVKSILHSLVIPYFIFTTLIAIPKELLRQVNTDWGLVIIQIITGRASWFIAALIVGELMFLYLLLKTRGKTWWLSIDVFCFFILYYIIPFNKQFNEYNYWQWQDALLTVTFLFTGYVYHQYQKVIDSINKPLYSLFLLLIFISIKVYEYHVDFPMRNIAIENVPLFVADAFIWLLLVTAVIRYIPRCRMIEWTGRHSIVYYFLAGACPLTVSTLMNRVGMPYDSQLWHYLLAVLLVYLLATALTWLIYRYLPFITGKRNG